MNDTFVGFAEETAVRNKQSQARLIVAGVAVATAVAASATKMTDWYLDRCIAADRANLNRKYARKGVLWTAEKL